ncbi:HNH endonuclease [Streptomyces iranensis]|uniref:HNH nuclease n=1 Tax=Streptomyces iranensis TaxID=576784 RepID=A0A060ZKJ3_9ACTN|nr:HNH endonuclease [Streptomyces iranensis]MBP2061047.1 hypothetical protein [Streptomyces iranensis]CDR06523.1 HNH nuclease [Streptomyces iranensis]
MARSRPKTAVRHLRRLQLADRDGWRCAYCRHPFHSPAGATTDHVAPYSLLRTWSVGALVLACFDCNNRKGDRFPLSIALLLLRSIDPTRPVVRPIDLPLLARLAHANQAIQPALGSADHDGRRSTCHLPESTVSELERTAA